MKWGLVAFNGDGPAAVAVGVAGVPVVVAGVATVAVGGKNDVKAIPPRSPGLNSLMKYSLLIWKSMTA